MRDDRPLPPGILPFRQPDEEEERVEQLLRRALRKVRRTNRMLSARWVDLLGEAERASQRELEEFYASLLEYQDAVERLRVVALEHAQRAERRRQASRLN